MSRGVKGVLATAASLLLWAAIPSLLEIWTFRAPYSLQPGTAVVEALYKAYPVLMCCLAALGLIFIGRCAAAGREGLKSGRAWLLAGLGMVVALPFGVVGMQLGKSVRIAALEMVAQRGDPIVDAVEVYTHDRGAPPGRLRDLAPGYIQSIPGTGVAAYPEFSYHAGRDSSGREIEYELFVKLGRAYGTWAVLRYRPSKTDLDKSQDVGRWAYYDE